MKDFDEFLNGPYKQSIAEATAASIDEALSASGIDLDADDPNISLSQVMKMLALVSQNNMVRTLGLYHHWLHSGESNGQPSWENL